MKILVIFTGGTIGSTVSGDYISTDSSKPYIILQKYNELFPNSIEWDTVSPYTILSENVTVNTYRKLYESVKEGLNGNYDGIIITHGSDTLQYSAAFLSVMFGRNIIPIHLVCSNYVLEDERANGMDNFAAAVDFIVNGRGRGVYVPYKNAGENVKIHRGEALMPHNLYSDYLYSLPQAQVLNMEYEITQDKETVPPDFEADNTGVLVIQAMPGLVYPKSFEAIQSVLLYAYHGGTFCVEDEGLQRFMAAANELDIPVYLVGANPETDYDSCREYEQLGIKVLGHISPIYAYMKLWIEPESFWGDYYG